MSVATQTTQVLWAEVRALLKRIRLENDRPVRLLGMGVSNLSRNMKKQQSLFDQEEQVKATRIDATADSIRDRFGSAAVNRASSLEQKIKFRADPRIED